MKNDAQTEYEHCELSVGSEPILAVSETPQPYDISMIHRLQWQTMTFNAFELGSTDAVRNAYDVLREGALSLNPFMKCPGANAAPPLSINTAYVGGSLFSRRSRHKDYPNKKVSHKAKLFYNFRKRSYLYFTNSSEL